MVALGDARALGDVDAGERADDDQADDEGRDEDFHQEHAVLGVCVHAGRSVTEGRRRRARLLLARRGALPPTAVICQ